MEKIASRLLPATCIKVVLAIDAQGDRDTRRSKRWLTYVLRNGPGEILVSINNATGELFARKATVL